MFRREKDNRLDNEGLRRMREAIRQRLDQEPDADDTEGVEPFDDSYLQQSPTSEAYGQATTYPSSTASAYGSASGESAPSFLTAGRQDRTLPAFELPTVQTRAEAAPWTPAEPAQPAGPMVTTVAADTSWRGKLRSAASIRIAGTFEGQVETEQDLTVTAEAKVEATVRATNIVVAGQLSGQITCHERLEILPTGRVSGQIDAGRFIVHEGAYLGGQVRMAQATSEAADARPLLQRVR